MVYALTLGLSFGIMVLFVNSIEALAIVFVLVTADVVAANTSDLKALEKDKGLLVFIILCALFTIGISYYISEVFPDIFVPLVVLNIATLSGYVIMRRMPRYATDTEF